MTNKATLWYVPLSLKNVNKVVEVPPIQVGLGASTGGRGQSQRSPVLVGEGILLARGAWSRRRDGGGGAAMLSCPL